MPIVHEGTEAAAVTSPVEEESVRLQSTETKLEVVEETLAYEVMLRQSSIY
jgi:hypothetical protein